MPVLAKQQEPLDQSMTTKVTLAEYREAKAAANARGIGRDELLREALINELRRP